jgi:hypothetical protein
MSKNNQTNNQNRINFVPITIIDYNSIDQSTAVVNSRYTGRKRKLFKLRLKKFIHLQTVSVNTERSNFEYPNKHRLLARIHDDYVDNLVYGAVALISNEKELHVFLKFEIDVKLT